jgi:hypothetical protein
MAGTWTSTTLACISYYGQNLNLVTLAGSSCYGWNWANYGHETSFGILFFFNNREFGGWYLQAETHAVWEEK